MNGPSDRARRPAWELLALAAVLVVAITLRVRELLATPLWVDEIYILFVARQPLPVALDTVARDIHPPLWFTVSHFWIVLGGTGERWLKTLPLLCSIAGILGVYTLGRRFVGATTGLIAALLLALHTTHVHWSQQFEDYSLVWALLPWAVVTTWALHERPSRTTAAAVVVVGVLALYTDYLAAFLFMLITAWGIWTLRGDRARLRWWIGTLAVLALLFVPQIPTWARQFAREGYGSHFHWPARADLLRLARIASFGPSWMPLVTLVLSAIALARSATRRAASLILVAILPVLFVPRAWPFVVQRDMLYVLPFTCLLIALGLSAISSRPVQLALLALFLTFAVRRITEARPWAEPTALRHVETRLRQYTKPGALILHAEPHTLFYCEYHLPDRRNRLLSPPGERVPYFDSGLMIADSAYWTPSQWRSYVGEGHDWFALHADRAFVQFGIPKRAGAWGRAQFDSAGADLVLHATPVTLWMNSAGDSVHFR